MQALTEWTIRIETLKNIPSLPHWPTRLGIGGRIQKKEMTGKSAGSYRCEFLYAEGRDT
jgi:hypothetical protein